MKNAVIIEDEKPVAQSLVSTLKEVAPDMQIKAILTSVEDSINYFSVDVQADIIFCDVQLTDGLSFSIFNEIHIDAPIIFITGYDKFMLNAFEYNSIDYLLKPVCKEDLQKALRRFLNKFYLDKLKRTLILGINPGRYGAGITGVNFTAAKQLKEFCGIDNPFKGSELSAEFIYQMIRRSKRVL